MEFKKEINNSKRDWDIIALIINSLNDENKEVNNNVNGEFLRKLPWKLKRKEKGF